MSALARVPIREPVTAIYGDGPTSDEHDFYPIHEEDSVPQGIPHDAVCNLLRNAYRGYRPDLWMFCDACLYWEPGNNRDYLAADFTVIEREPPASPPNVYLAWRDGPLLFVSEIASPSNTRAQMESKRARYEKCLKAPECLYAYPADREMTLWRLREGEYEQAAPGPDGRLWSEKLGVWLGYDEHGELRMYTPDRVKLPTPEEVAVHAREQEQRAREQEQRAREQEQRADAEERLRRELEARILELEQQLANASISGTTASQ